VEEGASGSGLGRKFRETIMMSTLGSTTALLQEEVLYTRFNVSTNYEGIVRAWWAVGCGWWH